MPSLNRTASAAIVYAMAPSPWPSWWRWWRWLATWCVIGGSGKTFTCSTWHWPRADVANFNRGLRIGRLERRQLTWLLNASGCEAHVGGPSCLHRALATCSADRSVSEEAGNVGSVVDAESATPISHSTKRPVHSASSAERAMSRRSLPVNPQFCG